MTRLHYRPITNPVLLLMQIHLKASLSGSHSGFNGQPNKPIITFNGLHKISLTSKTLASFLDLELKMFFGSIHITQYTQRNGLLYVTATGLVPNLNPALIKKFKAYHWKFHDKKLLEKK